MHCSLTMEHGKHCWDKRWVIETAREDEVAGEKKNKCKKLNELDVAQKNESEEVWTTASSGKLL